MKFLASFATCAALVGAAVAQGVLIGAPAPGSTVSAGSSIVVEIDRPDTLTPSIEVAIVIGFQSCINSNIGFPDGVCPSPDDSMGTILYNGPYDPQFQDDGTVNHFPHQNFTVTIPPSAPNGTAQLNVAHVALVGAVKFPLLQTRNITLVVA
ncbi:hypothetical protein C8F01DRAFT_122908 [Mycena amicta]|nr:hypothetical protein C8F01DRAFT_122908 [Mycena amicta]